MPTNSRKSSAANTASSESGRRGSMPSEPTGSDLQEAPQREPRAERRHPDSAAHEHRDEDREGDHVGLSDELDGPGQRIDQRDLGERQQTDRGGAAERAQE